MSDEYQDPADQGCQASFGAEEDVAALHKRIEELEKGGESAVRSAKDNRANYYEYRRKFEEARAELDALRGLISELEKDRDHWRDARRNAMEGGDMLKDELAAANRERDSLRKQVKVLREGLKRIDDDTPHRTAVPSILARADAIANKEGKE